VALRVLTYDVAPVWIPPAVLEVLGYGNILVPFSALALISVYYRLASRDAERLMEDAAMTDSLTSLPNRRRMRETLDAERVRFSRSRKPFSVILGDVDAFKQINDTRGHECGDLVLRELAALLRGILRRQDMVARWGGEEFLFLLPDTERAGAGVLADKLRLAVESAGLAWQGKPISVTMTFGVATFEADASSVEECIQRADRALYLGKEQGKNRVVLEPVAPPPKGSPPEPVEGRA
jgi:diguanylate cyclase (GGDEF)-like protein